MTAVLFSPALAALPGRDAPEQLRIAGDLAPQRQHAWSVLAAVSRPAGDGSAAFEHWYGEDEVFARESASRDPQGIRGFAHRASLAAASGRTAHTQTGDAPVLTYTLYDPTAYRHIRGHRLYQRRELDRLLRGTVTPPTVPSFPTDAVIVKTAWWPVAKDGITAMPVWDPELNPALPTGNGYLTWRRAVAVDAGHLERGRPTVDVEIAGRRFVGARRVRLEALHHVTVDASLAARVMHDRDARKAVLIALGRPLAAGDHLALVGANLATREIADWVWIAVWWHDSPEHGTFGADRPNTVRGEWRNYLLQVAFDAVTPRQADGSSHVCFNPWLEARFPDGGQGGGTVSNCMACHRRASYPPVPFLPVTRGAEFVRDPSVSSGQLRTSLLWSLALHAAP